MLSSCGLPFRLVGKAGERIFGAMLLAAEFGPALAVVIHGVQQTA
jgi:hypothetical protein